MQDAAPPATQQQQAPAKKRALDEDGSYGGRNDATDAVARLQDRLEKKEAQIDNLLQTINELTAQVKSLHDLIAKMQPGHAAPSEDSAEAEDNL